MEKNLSPSEVKRGISSGQVVKVREMFEHGILKSTVFNNALTADVDRFIKTAVPDLNAAWMDLLDKRFQYFISATNLLVDYDVPGAIIKAVDETEIKYKHIRLPLSDIPLIGHGEVVHEIHEVRFDRKMFIYNLKDALQERSRELGIKGVLRLADPLTALSLACAFPNRQKQYSFGTFFNCNGQLWHLCLDTTASAHSMERSLQIVKTWPDSVYPPAVSLLVVYDSSTAI